MYDTFTGKIATNMAFLPIIILSIIQGITEFLPISSSGHLVLIHELMSDELNKVDQKRLDIAVHIGTLLAVILYFQSDFIKLILGGFDILRLRFNTDNAIQSRLIIIASIPVIIAGFILFSTNMTLFDGLHIMAWMSIIFGLLLYIADKQPETTTTIQNLTVKNSLFYGFAQCLALIPGVSRSGITMTAGRFLGHSRTESARMSLLMGMVTIAAAGILTSLSLFQSHPPSNDFLIIAAIGIAVSFITAYIAIWIMMKWFSGKGTMVPFVIYRVSLGVVLLSLLYGGIIS